MFDLLKTLDTEIKKNKLGGTLPPPFVASSGFDVLDIMNGTRDPETDKVLAGMAESKVVGFIGKSGSGKTSLAIQVASNLCHTPDGKLIPNAAVIHIDGEGSSERPRIKTLTRKTESELQKFYRHINDDSVNTENLFKMIDVICTQKKENRDDLLVELTDRNGDKFTVLPPTVILIDSIAAMNTTAENDDDTLGSNMLA